MEWIGVQCPAGGKEKEKEKKKVCDVKRLSPTQKWDD